MRKIKLTLTVTKEVREMLNELSKYKGKSVSKMVDEMATLEYKRMKRALKKASAKENKYGTKE